MTRHVSPRDTWPGDEARVRAGHWDEEGAGGEGEHQQGVDSVDKNVNNTM